MWFFEFGGGQKRRTTSLIDEGSSNKKCKSTDMKVEVASIDRDLRSRRLIQVSPANCYELYYLDRTGSW